MDEDDIKHVYGSLRYYFSGTSDFVKFSFYKPVKPVLQNGPCCGLVALAMAAQLITEEPLSVDTIFEEAKSRCYTLKGEMFSCRHMADLAQVLLKCDSSVVGSLSSNNAVLVHHILSGCPILIPYDADKNNTPCCEKGHHAHWAVISGICITVPPSAVESCYNVHQVYDTNNGPFMQSLLKEATRIFVLAHHGKSRHLAMWDLEELLVSNANLFELGEKHNPDEMILPRCDFLRGLRNRAVLLKPFC